MIRNIFNIDHDLDPNLMLHRSEHRVRVEINVDIENSRKTTSTPEFCIRSRYSSNQNLACQLFCRLKFKPLEAWIEASCKLAFLFSGCTLCFTKLPGSHKMHYSRSSKLSSEFTTGNFVSLLRMKNMCDQKM